MKILLTCTVLFLSTLTLGQFVQYAQFAIVQDKDGYSNVRDSAGPKAKIIDKLNNGHFVYCLEAKNYWVNIEYTRNKVESTGYLYYDRLKLISEFISIPILKKEADATTLAKDSIKVIVTQQPFDRSKYKLSFDKETKTYIQLVDGKQYWGTDGEMPRTEYKSIIILIGKRKIIVPRSAFRNLFEPSLYATEVDYDAANDILYIQSSNSDGAGFYQIIWRIERGIYKDRYVAYGF